MNDWLDRKAKRKKLDGKTLDNIDNIIRQWHVDGTGSDKISMILNVLATNVIDYLKPEMALEERCFVHPELVDGCLARLTRLNVDKGRAFNFFTTIMLGILRQYTMTARDMKKAKEEYREFIASRNSRNRDRR